MIAHYFVIEFKCYCDAITLKIVDYPLFCDRIQIYCDAVTSKLMIAHYFVIEFKSLWCGHFKIDDCPLFCGPIFLVALCFVHRMNSTNAVRSNSVHKIERIHENHIQQEITSVVQAQSFRLISCYSYVLMISLEQNGQSMN